MRERTGFKQTEVGPIPEDWGASTVGQEFEIQLGKMLDSEKNSGVRKYYVGNKAVQWGRIDTAALPTMALSSSELSRFRLCHGDLLVCEGGEIGRAAIWESPIDECYYQKALHRLRPRRGFSPYLLLSFLQHWTDRGRLANYITKTSIAHLTKEKLEVVPLPVPSPGEQRAIAAALSDVDALIRELDRLIAKKRDIKRAAMQELLTGRKRLPGCCGEWEIVELSDVANKKVPWSITGGPFGSNLKASDYVSGGVRVIQLQNIGDGIFNDDFSVYTSERKADELLSCNIFPGEIILSKMGDPVARGCFLPDTDRRYLMASDGIRLVVDEQRFDKAFVLAYINSAYFRRPAIEASTGSTRQRIGLEYLKRLPFVAPPLAAQHAIAAILSDMDAEITALEQKRDKTRAIKQGMMQELLTGKTRLV
ncbi:MAG: restriction endonuclease subunit S [Chloroflexi bacterium]|nr:restriction endonuclease subunit S [Chloroflexota bacterium]